LREEANGILVGPYETETAHVCNPPAWNIESELVAPELDRLVPFLERDTERLPLFGQIGLKSVISGAITHTVRRGAAQLLDALRCLRRTVGSSRCEVSSAISQHTAVPTAWAPSPTFKFATPVRLPPGRLRLVTSPTSIGSVST
jgi:hypothetical protein